ncbi:MAG TPA: ATP-dependent RNA helicase [Desulfobacteraceae bacterium]|nr:ATP-dependent RNA helicase [Desulfobacteraceae bacterium]
MSDDITPASGFDHLPLSAAVLSAVSAAGYKTPTPIQENAIPVLARGRDLIGQARTGTGKTAAFALPLISRIDTDLDKPQVLVLTPTRELAIQVAEAFKTYGRNSKGLRVLPVYGGQSYAIQLKQLKRGVHVVVGTPGRIMDHIQRKTISLAHLFCRVLDEADEMLHMGFIDDVEWIFSQVSHPVQTALFSATMPAPIKRIAQTYLETPEEITLRSQSLGLESITQKFWLVKGAGKIIALSRILDATCFDAAIVFVKTKSSTLDVCRQLEDKGFRAEALNGDMAQDAREKTVERLKQGRIDILVATDVAARGLDVDRISHVINYDLPDKTDPYIHRIGRTGRAGRKGEALLFVHPRERWMLRKLEKATGHPISQIQLPSNRAINKKRVQDFRAAIRSVLDAEDLGVFENLITAYAEEEGLPMATVAAALGKMAHGDTPFFLTEKLSGQENQKSKKAKKDKIPGSKTLESKIPGSKILDSKIKDKKSRAKLKDSSTGKSNPGKDIQPAADLKDRQPVRPLEKGMDRYRIEVGRSHGVKARDIVGAISNEAGLESRFIKGISIKNKFSVVDLPEGMPKDIFHVLKKTWLRQKPMAISRLDYR